MSHHASESDARPQRRWEGPRLWALSAFIGIVLGFAAGLIIPTPPRTPTPLGESADLVVVEHLADGTTRIMRGPGAESPHPSVGDGHGHALDTPNMPWYALVPFAALLGGIALMPFVNAKWWHHHYPDAALFLGGFVGAFYVAGLGAYGRVIVLHAGLEYYAFIALVGGLYVAAGGMMLDLRLRATPLNNTLILAAGAVLANLVGTTGASMILIRPFLRINSEEHGGRLHPLHVVFFIFIVSNCGGCLTPIGDPPLYLGFLKGVPFVWTMQHMWPMWLLVNGLLLGAFFGVDAFLARGRPPKPLAGPDLAKGPVRVSGLGSILCLGLIVAAVFIDPLLKKLVGFEGFPVGASVQLLVGAIAYFTSSAHVHRANGFNFEPVKEVALLFAGIFLTMAPALAFLDQHAPSLGLETPTQFYFATGALSAVLDNAPTYLSFLQIAFSVLGLEVTAAEIAKFIDGTFTVTHAGSGVSYSFAGQQMLEGISLGAVFFGAMTYIGNGPNFMVKAIAEARGVKMPSFFGYLGWAGVFLGPVLVVNWWVFVR